MSKRNIAWLVAVIVAGVVVWIAAGILWGLLAAVITLVASETIERAQRKKRRAARGETAAPRLSDAVKARRKKP
jgi:hypothetical protein